MTHTGNDGNPGFKDGPHYDFFIEGPEIFNASSVPYYNALNREFIKADF
jgi:hypothetical protein